jgi:LysM repeat protein
MFVSSTSNHRASLFAGTFLVAAALFLGHVVPSSGAGHPRHHRVRAGETLWGIASSGYPDSDPRAAVDRIEQANHLTSASIVPGQVLLLP